MQWRFPNHVPRNPKMWPTPLKVAKEEEETKQAGFHLQQLWLPVGLLHNRWFEESFLLMFF